MTLAHLNTGQTGILPNSMIRFDLHMHTRFSPCSNLEPETVLKRAIDTGLTHIAITDHNTAEGAIEALELQRKYPQYGAVTVYPGIEFRTKYGEMNAIFQTAKEVLSFDKMREGKYYDLAELVGKIEEMRKKGVQILVGLNHPVSLSFFSKRGGFDIDRAVMDGLFSSTESLFLFFDYVEINTNNLRRAESDAAMNLALMYGRPLIVNTDSHWKWQIGRYYTASRFDDPIEAILAANGGDDTALILPDKISYSLSWYYRTKSGIRKKYMRSHC